MNIVDNVQSILDNYKDESGAIIEMGVQQEQQRVNILIQLFGNDLKTLIEALESYDITNEQMTRAYELTNELDELKNTIKNQ